MEDINSSESTLSFLYINTPFQVNTLVKKMYKIQVCINSSTLCLCTYRLAEEVDIFLHIKKYLKVSGKNKHCQSFPKHCPFSFETASLVAVLMHNCTVISIKISINCSIYQPKNDQTWIIINLYPTIQNNEWG